MTVGYTPQRVASLKSRASAALSALNAIHSDDPASVGAATAVGLLRSSLEHTMLPALLAIERADPLARYHGFSVAPMSADGHERWMQSKLDQFEGTEWSHLSSFDLTLFVQFELTRQVEENGMPDLDDPFWSDDFPDLVTEFEYRSRTDEHFVEWLIEEADTNPLIGSIVAAGDFTTPTVVGVLHSLVTAETLGITRDEYRRQPIIDLLTGIVDEPDRALDVLTSHGFIEAAYTWNFDELNPMEIPEHLLSGLAAAALNLPFESGRRIDDAYVALGGFVDLADTRHFDTGFSGEVSVALAETVVSYLPLLLDSFGQPGEFFGKNFYDDRAVSLGTEGDVINFLGALLRDRDSFDLLLATIPVLSMTAGDRGHDIQDVTDYVEALGNAADNEQQEEVNQAQRERNRWNNTIGVVSGLLDKALDGAGPLYEPTRSGADLLTSGARWFVDQIDADDAGLDHVDDIAHLLLMLGFSAHLIDNASVDRDDATDDDARNDRLDAAREELDDVRDALERGSAPEELRAKILDLRESVERYAGLDAFEDVDRVRPAELTE